MMMPNPFTPALMASSPDAFYGRNDELNIVARAIRQGSVAIQGPVGIGKSSLLSRTLLHMDGFMSDEESICLIAVGHSDIQTIDDAARLLLEELVEVDERQEKIRIGIPKIAQYESSEVYQQFKAGRHLAALTRIIEDKAFKELLHKKRQLLFAIDEVEKCARPIARLIRTIVTKTQLNGMENIRFLLAGVSPFFSEMIDEDQGVSRFIYKAINLGPLLPGESRQLLEEKFSVLSEWAKRERIDLIVDPTVIERIDNLSGGHPHLLQLLGSHVIEHESQDPDGRIDARDLMDSLRSICYESRGPVYETLIHRMEDAGSFTAFKACIELSGSRFPGIFTRQEVVKRSNLDSEHLQWLLESNVIGVTDEGDYRIVDEFLRIRVILDAESQSVTDIEDAIVNEGELVTYDEIEFDEGDAPRELRILNSDDWYEEEPER